MTRLFEEFLYDRLLRGEPICNGTGVNLADLSTLCTDRPPHSIVYNSRLCDTPLCKHPTPHIRMECTRISFDIHDGIVQLDGNGNELSFGKIKSVELSERGTDHIIVVLHCSYHSTPANQSAAYTLLLNYQ